MGNDRLYSLTSLAERMLDGVVEVTLEGRILDCNKAYMDMLGYSLDELRELRYQDITPSRWFDFERNIIENQVKVHGSSKVYEKEYIHKSGRIIPIELRAFLIESDDGPSRIWGIVRDITELKKTQNQLNHLQKMDALGQMAGGIAHDFNNLLGGILGAVDLLTAKSSENDEDRQYLDIIRTMAERAADLTQNLLLVAKKAPVIFSPLSINKLVKDAASVLRSTLNKSVTIDVKTTDDLGSIQGDQGQLISAIINLGINAGHAMPQGGLLQLETYNVEFSAEAAQSNPLLEELPAGHYGVIEVQDNGSGIPKETLPHIFDPFFTTKNKDQGTGLGLATVYGTVKQHLGSIHVYSEEGHGTSFKLFLPLSSSNEEPAKVLTQIQHGEGNILLVDDEDALRETTAKLLNNLGYSVQQSSNGESALEIYRQQGAAIDLILLDILMPGMGGLKCLEELKQLNADCRVLLTSGFCLDRDLEKGLQLGALGFLRKPYTMVDLGKQIHQVLKKE